MKIYIDSDYKCHTSAGDGLREIETEFFDNTALGYIEDETIEGEMVSPWKDWEELDGIQREYERSQNRELTAQNAELMDAMASMVEDVYNQDVAVIEGE